MMWNLNSKMSNQNIKVISRIFQIVLRQSYLNKQNEVKIYHATQFPNELIFSHKALSEFSN
jgi:hypothetical protein